MIERGEFAPPINRGIAMAKKTPKVTRTGGKLIDARSRFARHARQERLAIAVISAGEKLEALRQATLDMAALIATSDDYEGDPAEFVEAVHAIMSGPVGGAIVDALDELEAAIG
jgi:hypothetical protein